MATIENSARISTSAINAYTNKKVQAIYGKSVLMGAIKARGRQTNNHAGKSACNWFPEFRTLEITPGAGNPVSISFPQTNIRREVTLPWRNYNLGQSITKYEQLVTEGRDRKSVLFRIVDDTIDKMTRDFMNSFRLKLYKDGNAAGSTQDIHGLESIFSATSCVTSSIAGNPTGTYAGQSMALGVTGDWTADSSDGWPTGTGDAEYGWWSPLEVDYGNTALGGTTNSWANQWQEAINYGISYLSLLRDSTPDLLLLNGKLLYQAKNSLKSTQRFEITQNSDLTKLGHKTLQFEGLEIATEYGVPDAVGYLITFDQLEMRSLQGQLFGKMDDDDISTATKMLAMDFYGQLIFWSPAYFGKLLRITALGT
jgi:hypothetical protein